MAGMTGVPVVQVSGAPRRRLGDLPERVVNFDGWSRRPSERGGDPGRGALDGATPANVYGSSGESPAAGCHSQSGPASQPAASHGRPITQTLVFPSSACTDHR